MSARVTNSKLFKANYDVASLVLKQLYVDASKTKLKQLGLPKDSEETKFENIDMLLDDFLILSSNLGYRVNVTMVKDFDNSK